MENNELFHLLHFVVFPFLSMFFVQIKDRKLLLKFVFETSPSSQGLTICSLDKYMSHGDWKSVFAVLTNGVDKFFSNDECSSGRSATKLHSNQLELTVSWRKVRGTHTELVGLSAEHLHPVYMRIEVKTISKVDEFRAQQLTPKRNRERTDQATRNPAVSMKKLKFAKVENRKEHEEYVPETKHVSPSVGYTPTKRDGDGDGDGDMHEEYTPSALHMEHRPENSQSNSSEAYQPAHANNNNDSNCKHKASVQKTENESGTLASARRPSRECKTRLRENLYVETEPIHTRSKSTTRHASNQQKKVKPNGDKKERGENCKSQTD